MKSLIITKYRDFGKIIEDSLKFFFNNWKKILSLYLIFAMPFYILSVALYSIYSTTLNRVFEVGGEEIQFSLATLFAGVAGLLSFVAFTLAIYSYAAWRAEEEQKEIPDFENWWAGTLDRMKVQAWHYIGVLLIFFLGVVISLGFASLFMVFNIFLGGLTFLVLFFVLIYYSVALSYVQYSAVENPNRSFWNHFGYGFYLIKGYWWETLGLLIVMGLIRMVVTMILSIPFMLYSIIEGFSTGISDSMDAFNSMTYTWASSALGALFYVIVVVAIVFKYYSIIEMKEGTSLQERIDQFDEKGSTHGFENEGGF